MLKVLFEFKGLACVARVILGSTGAMGDVPDEVVSLRVIDQAGNVFEPRTRLYKAMCERAIETAKEELI